VAGLDHSLSVSAYDIDRKSLSAFPSRYTAERQVLRWTGARGGADDAFAFVVGAERSASTADLDGRDSIDLSAGSVFGVGRLHAGERLTFTGSLRYDDPDRFKGRATARLAAAARLGTGLTLTASAGQGFKIPTISQVICDFCFPAGPSLNLKPERAEGYDLRLGWSADDGRYSAALTGYRLSVRDQIYYGTGRYINIARTRSTGLEAEGEAQITGTLRLKLAYAWMDAIDASTGASLLRVPDHSGAATLFWEDQAWSATFTLRGESSQSDTARDGFSRVSREGFWTADLAGAYALNDQVSFTARIENLADEKYQETFGYGEPGRALYVGVRLRR
jgi:vitamin B12 transporter